MVLSCSQAGELLPGEAAGLDEARGGPGMEIGLGTGKAKSAITAPNNWKCPAV